MSGATPRGAANEQEAAAWVRDMFGRVAPRYDLLNHLLSFNIDRHWRSANREATTACFGSPGCHGRRSLLRYRRPDAGAAGQGKGSRAGQRFLSSHADGGEAKGRSGSPFFEADALRLPIGDRAVDAITVAFGFRNLANYEAGLRELRRVLKPGGIAAILEFSQPPNPAFNALYGFYSKNILPRIGGLISGASDAYTYLPDSVRKFPDAPGLAAKMSDAGFRNVAVRANDLRHRRAAYGCHSRELRNQLEKEPPVI